MDDFLVTVLSLLVLISLVQLLITYYFLRRQTIATERSAAVEEKRFYMSVKHLRNATFDAELPGGAYAWLTGQVKEEYGLSVEFEEKGALTLDSTPVLVAPTTDGDSLVVSPLKLSQLRKRLKKLVNSRGSLAVKLTDEGTVLELLRKARDERNRSLQTAGEFFDIEAQKADQELNVGWGSADVLYMSFVSA